MKVLKTIKNVIVGIVFITYLLLIIAASSLYLSRSKDYGVSEFGDYALIIIDDEVSNDSYKSGDLVIVKSMKYEDIKLNDEIFIYSPNYKDTKVDIIISTVSEIVENNSVLLTNGGTWHKDYIAGQAFKTIPKLGRILTIIQNKWIFAAIFLVPCFFILLYEIYRLVVSIKYDDYYDDEYENAEIMKEEPKEEKSSVTRESSKAERVNIKNDYEEAAARLIASSDDAEADLMKIKEKLLAEKKEKDKQSNVETLLREIEELKKELNK